jgi:hypothetical protein
MAALQLLYASSPLFNHAISHVYNHDSSPLFHYASSPLFNHAISHVYNHDSSPLFVYLGPACPALNSLGLRLRKSSFPPMRIMRGTRASQRQ